MAADLQKLTPKQLCRLLNSTPLGVVISDAVLSKHRTRAGYRIGNDRHVNCLQYIAWLNDFRNDKPNQERLRADTSKQRRYSQKIHDESADVGELHAVQNPGRRQLCMENLALFLQWYFPESTGMGVLSPDHFDLIDGIENCLRGFGGWYANAVYRGFAKTSISEGSVLWAMLGGRRRFCPVFGADDDHAKGIVASLCMELVENDRLFDDFPEVCIPFRALEGKYQRCRFQRYRGDLTHIHCIGDEIILPTLTLPVDEAASLGIPVDDRGRTLNSGGVIVAQSLLSARRGMKHKRPDGVQLRPDCAIIDDGETDTSAASATETRNRINRIRKAIIPMSGQRKKMAIIVNGTTIQPGAMMDQLLDPQLSPGWRGRRVPMMRSMATAEKLWLEEYAKILTTWDRENPCDQERARRDATEFYLERRAEMDAGADATWHTCYAADEGEVSAIQHAYNILIEQGAEVFAAECQQKPIRAGQGADDLKQTDIIAKANGVPRGVVPSWAHRVTIMTDVQDNALYWLALATGVGFAGHVLDYGIFPEQHIASLSYKDAKATLRQRYSSGMEGGLVQGIKELCGELSERPWVRDGDDVRMVSAISGVDSADNTATIYAGVRNAAAPGLVPTRGRGVLAKHAPWIEYKDRPGEELNREYRWMFAPTAGSGQLRVFQYDVNWWKSFVMSRLRTVVGDQGALTFWGRPADHLQLSDHILGEYAVKVTANGRTVEEWSLRVGQDNHLFDVLVGAHALAARAGATLDGIEAAKRPERRKFKMPGAR